MSFFNVKFNAKAHSYTLNGKKLKAVNKFIADYKKPFDREKMAERSAKKKGVSVEALLEEWDAKAGEGLKRGTLVHQHIRKILENKLTIYDMESKINEASIPHIGQFNQFWDLFSKDFHVYAVEKVIGNSDLGIGGTVDTVFLNLKENVYNIWDWKTNSSFSIENPWDSLFPPFDGFEASDLAYFSLQVSTYRLIYEIEHPELTFGDSYICHLSDNSYTVHKAYDFRSRIYEELTKGTPDF